MQDEILFHLIKITFMKKLLLIACAVSISAGLYAQKAIPKAKANIKSYSAQMFDVAEEVPVQSPSIVNAQPVNTNRGTNDITVLNIGGAANAYGLYNGGRTALWADPNLNSVSFFHRMLGAPNGPGSGFIGYDYSTDGGSTWSVNNQIYNPTIVPGANARYPQGVLVNPAGNTDPNNAYAVSVSAILDGSNAGAGSWGGLGATLNKFDGSVAAQQSWPTVGAFRNNVPDAMTVNPVTGDIFVVDNSMIAGLGNQYVDTLVITRGVVTNGEIEWTQSLLYAPVNAYGTSVADVRIAFAPDGMIGYICTLSDNGGDDFATESAYYPILYKTTDGGLTWDEDAIVVPLGGPDGLPAIVYGLMDDDQWLEFWGDPVPARDEIIFTTAFTSDFAVDFNGNPVLTTVVGVSGIHGTAGTAYSILSGTRTFASYNIFSQDGGATWLAQKLGDNLITFRGEFGATDPIAEDNRSQLTTSLDGTKMFFSWLDTDFEGQEDNVQPDIYCVGWDIINNTYSEVYNVTFLSDAWLQAFMGTASYYAFESGDGYIIPFAYQQMAVENNAIDPTLPVQYKYIPDFMIDNFDFSIGVNKVENNVTAISQNYPNPSSDITNVNVTLAKSAKVSLEVYNMVGQKVYEIPARNLTEGTHPFEINVASLKAGVYTYAVIANGERSTRKMMVN